MAHHLFTSESVTEGHPDKICDQISDAILDAILAQDPNGRVACECTVTTGVVNVMGEITTDCYVDIPKVVRQTVREIGYDRAKYGFDCETCAVITNIGDAHIEFLGSREGILKAKSEIFENLDADGVAILNGDDALLDTVALPQRIVRCGESAHADVRVSALRDRGIDGIACTVTTARAAYHLRIPAPGRHMIYAASLAAAVGEELGLSVPEIERGVALYEPAGSRMRVHRLSGARRLLDDCYNANPQSMSAALRVLAASEGKKIAVLGDMKELGELTESAHRAMGELCALLGIDRVIAVGEYAHGIADAAHESAEWYPDAESAVDAARAAFTEGSVLLCKASHSMHLEKIVEELLKTT